MCRLVKETDAERKPEQKVYGVLTDFDLSSWKKDLEGDYARTSQQRTGTPPYMAQELLQGTSTTHLYRHDLESLFYIMLLMAARHTIVPARGGPDTVGISQVVMRKGPRPYQTWFDAQPYHTLGALKQSFITNTPAIELSPVFEDFRPWLKTLRSRFSKGFKSKPCSDDWEELSLWSDEEPVGGLTDGASVPFDDETLGGYVDYSTIIKPAKRLKGALEGLIIRYETTPPRLPTPTGAV